MAKPVKLAPSMLSADWSRAGAVVDELVAAGCPWLHFDAMDGRFVPNITMGPMFLHAVRARTQAHFDAHLMLEGPGAYIKEFAAAGANSINVHVEGNAHLHRLVQQIKDAGALAGVAINPATPVSALEAVLPDLDIVLVMSVDPGFGGQRYLQAATEKIAHFDRRRSELGLNYLINVDGGMSPQTAPAAAGAGADVLVCGASSIFIEGLPIADNVAAMHAAIAAAS